MSYLLSIIIGVFSSLTAAIVFLLIICRFKPKIIISDKVAHTLLKKGESEYKIKIIDKSSRRAVNIHADLYLVTPKTIPNGLMLSLKEIKLQRNSPLAFYKYDTRKADGKYACIFRTSENLKELWKDNEHTYLRFRIYAVDSLTGFGKLFTKIYYKKDADIVNGEFKFGSLQIIG